MTETMLMKITELSDRALRLWMTYFLTPGNTLRFGGKEAELAITAEGRAALAELIAYGAVGPARPDGEMAGREHYQAEALDLRDEIRIRAGNMNPFSWKTAGHFRIFERPGITAEDLIAAERRRQIESEGFSQEHDDGYTQLELMKAAIAYVEHGGGSECPSVTVPKDWPWPAEWWKPRSRRDDLTRAGALCLAERDRCERAKASVLTVMGLYVHVVQELDATLNRARAA